MTGETSLLIKVAVTLVSLLRAISEIVGCINEVDGAVEGKIWTMWHEIEIDGIMRIMLAFISTKGVSDVTKELKGNTRMISVEIKGIFGKNNWIEKNYCGVLSQAVES